MKKLSKITESIWSDMQDRSTGDVVRKEDDINLLDETGLLNYMKKVYMPPSPNDDLQIIGGGVNSGTIIASLFNLLALLIICLDFLSPIFVTVQVLITYTSEISEKSTTLYPSLINFSAIASYS